MRRSQYRSDIDGLRAVAVLAVIAYHAFPSVVTGGFVGVDVFFVISGFLISGIIIQEIDVHEFSVVTFYARRVRRIFPALAVVLIACLAAGWLLLFPDEYKHLGKHVVAGAGFSSNLLLWKETGYFDVGADYKPLLHLWSLGIEEQFYLIWPLFLAIASRNKRVLLPSLFTLMIASFVLTMRARGTTVAFYFPLHRFWELALGGILACVRGPTARLSKGVRSLASWAGVTLIGIAITKLGSHSTFPGPITLLPVIGTALVIVAGDRAPINRTLLSNSSIVGIGLISYPLYLWHWPALAFARIVQSGVLSTGVRVGLVLASFVLAYLTFIAIEKPVRFGRLRARAPAVLCAVLASVAALGFWVKRHDGVPSRFGNDAALVADLRYDPKLVLQPCPAEVDSASLGYCARSKPAPAVAAIVGDSHADHLFPGIAALDPNRSWLLIGHPSCPPLIGINVRVDQEACEDRMEAAIEYVGRSPAIQTVIVAYFGNYILDTDYAADHLQNHLGPSAATFTSRSRSAGDKAELFYAGLEASIVSLEKAGKRIVIVLDVPELPFSPRACVSRGAWVGPRSGCVIPRQAVLDRQRAARALATKLVAAHPKVLLFDPLDFMCDDTTCRAVADGVLLYRDSHHLSIRGSERLARMFLAWFANQP